MNCSLPASTWTFASHNWRGKILHEKHGTSSTAKPRGNGDLLWREWSVWRVVPTADTQLAPKSEAHLLFLPSMFFTNNFSRRALMVRFKPRKRKFLTMEIENMPQLINHVTSNSRKLTPRKSITTLCVGVGWVWGEASVRSHHYTLSNSPERHSSHGSVRCVHSG
jgi:hypothetical protein